MFDFIDPRFTFSIYINKKTGKKIFVEIYSTPEVDYIQEYEIT
jgi:hypothetical protein